VLSAELFAGAGGVGGDGFTDRCEFAQVVAEHARAADFLLERGDVLPFEAGRAAQFAGGFSTTTLNCWRRVQASAWARSQALRMPMLLNVRSCIGPHKEKPA